MDPGYGYSLDREAVAALLQCSSREQRRLVDAFETIARHPHALGDFSQTGLDGREHEVIEIGDLVVTFWPDHAVKTVRILLIERG